MDWIKRNWKVLLFCVLIATLFMFPVFDDAVLILWGDDASLQISRIEGLAQSIQLGNWFPKIYPLKSLYFGYAWPTFYCDTLLIFPAILYILGVPILTSYGIYCWICIFFSAFFMFRCVEEYANNKIAPWIGSVIYVFSNYIMLNYFLRNSMGENTAFVFFPCVLLGAHRLIHSNNMKIGYIIVAFTGLLLCHNVSFIYGCLLFALTLLINTKYFVKDKKKILYLGVAVFITIGLTAYFLFPMLEMMSKMDVLNFNIGHYGQYQGSSVPIYHFLKILPVVTWQTSLRRYTIGPFLIFIPILGSLYTIIKRKNINKELCWFTLFGVLFLFMTTQYFDIKLFAFGQFKWRIMGVATTVMTIPTAIYLSEILEKIQNGKIKKIVSFVCVTAYSLIWMFPAFQFLSIDNNKYNINSYSFQEVLDYNPSTRACGYFDKLLYGNDIDYLFLPTIWEENYCKPGCVLNLAGETITCDLIRNDGVTSMMVTQPIYNDFIDFPVIYYPGMAAVLQDDTGNVVRTSAEQDFDNGYTKVYLGDSTFTGKISVFYQGTRLQKASYILSAVSLIGVILCGIIKTWKNRKTHKD